MTVWSHQHEYKWEGGNPRKEKATEETYALKISSFQILGYALNSCAREAPWNPVESNS